jgi:O-antigen ligase
MKEIPIMPIVFVLMVISFAFSEKKLSNDMIKIVIGLFMVMMFSNIVNGWIGGSYVIFQEYLPVFLLYIILVNIVTDESKLLSLFNLFIFCAILMSVHGIQQMEYGVGWTGTNAYQNRIRYIGTMNDPNDLALFLVFSFILLIYFINATSNKAYKLYYLFAGLVLLYGIVLTNSRGGLLALIIALFLYYKSKKNIIITSVFIGVLILVFVNYASRLTEISTEESSASGRLDAWYTGLQLFKSNPIFGVGYGNFTEYNTLTAHNSYVLVLSELGIIGYYLWFMLLGATYYKIYLIYNYDKKNNESNNLSHVLFCALSSVVIAIFFLSRSYNIVFIIILALMYAYSQRNTELVNHPELTAVNYKKWFVLTLTSIVFLFVATKILFLI